MNGEIFAMARGTPEHGLMAVNVVSVLRSQLLGKSGTTKPDSKKVR
ncbi:hypothetical protein WME79_38590 [Sorangium sp. So ce726]